MAVRLSAARALAKCESWTFDESEFLPFLSDAVAHFLGLLTEVELTESRLKVMAALEMVIDRVRKLVRHCTPQRAFVLISSIQISPYGSHILAVLSSVFTSPDTEALLKSSIVATLAKLVNVGL